MKLISVKIHTDVVVAVSDDYDMDDLDVIRTIANGVKQDLVNVFDDTMVTVKEVKTIQDVPPEYLNVPPWLAPNLSVRETAELTCQELLTCKQCNAPKNIGADHPYHEA